MLTTSGVRDYRKHTADQVENIETYFALIPDNKYRRVSPADDWSGLRVEGDPSHLSLHSTLS